MKQVRLPAGWDQEKVERVAAFYERLTDEEAVRDDEAATSTVIPAELFIAYAHVDEPLKDELVKHLSAMQRSGLIRAWNDRRILPGANWNTEISDALNRCQIVLLLVSADFIHSDYCYGVEVKRALERHRHDEAQVIPVILRPCDWTDLPFAQYQALPKDARAVTSWSNRDEAYTEIARGIRTLLDQAPRPAATHESISISQSAAGSTVGPQLVIDYDYAEDSNEHRDANAPLVIRNISSIENAFNVRILPLRTEQGEVNFEPTPIPYIEATKSKNVFAWVREGSPLFRRRLPDFLFRTYKDESVEELFGTKTFTLCVRYEGSGGRKFETTCELNFRPWKKQVAVGRTETRSLAA
jgi:hypothetical protein